MPLLGKSTTGALAEGSQHGTGGILTAAVLKQAETENNLHLPQWGPGRIICTMEYHVATRKDECKWDQLSWQGKVWLAHLCAYPFMFIKNTYAMYGLGLNCLAWRIPWTVDPCELRSMGSQRVGRDWVTNTLTFKLSFGRIHVKLVIISCFRYKWLVIQVRHKI